MTHDPIYWTTRDGETLCAEDGERAYDAFVAVYGDDESPRPVFDWETSDGPSVIYCDACHQSVCASCGSDLDASDRDVRGPWWECWNCHTWHAFLDGQGYCWADDDRSRLTVGWTGTSDRVIPLEYRVPTPRLTDTAGIEYLTIDAVLWAGGGDALRVITYGPFGNAVLVEGGSEDDALSERDDWLTDRGDADAPDDEDGDRYPVRVFRLGAGERDALAYSGTERTIPRGGRHTSI